MTLKIFLNFKQGFYLVLKALFTLTVLTIFFLGTTSSSYAQSSKNLTISYKDYNNILKGLVLSKGPSSRIAPQKPIPPTGTRISFASRKNTRLEANRVMFHILSKKDKGVLLAIRKNLEALPSQISLEKLSRNEQLSYWLNLRNMMVISAVADAYPLTNLNNFWGNLENDKRLLVSGTPMSINDIETLVMTKWPRAEVIYGFYNGSIGGPNIRRRPFTGDTVWTDLEDNAREFINSLRGIQFTTDKAQISEFYLRYSTLFPDFDTDSLNHLEANLKPELAIKMRMKSDVRFDLSDWYIADLMNGRIGLGTSGTIGPPKNAASNPRGRQQLKMMKYPHHVQNYIQGRKIRVLEFKRKLRRSKEGMVTIDEVYGTEKDVPSKKNDKKTKN